MINASYSFVFLGETVKQTLVSEVTIYLRNYIENV
jgi:hypothetical protein